MKFVHIADMHFDRPFVNLSDKEIMGDLRRLEQRKIFKKVIEYIKANEIPYFFIAGDLYEHKYVKKSTIEYINNLFKEIPNTQIFITPGNHDPKIKNSYYNKFEWNENVKIFGSKIEKVELPEADIYGYGFDDFYCTNSNIENLQIENKEKLNVLAIHGTLDGASIEEKQYNSMSKKILEEKDFDYIALGHIHKKNYEQNEKQRIIYPGSTVSLGFDELGEHGMIVGEIDKENINLQFVPLDNEEFIEIEIPVDDIYSKEELIEKINSTKTKENEYAKIILIGNRNMEIEPYEILKFIENNRIIKIKNQTKLGYDLDRIEKETTLRGIFAKKMKEKLNDEQLSQEDKEMIEKAIEIGFETLE